MIIAFTGKKRSGKTEAAKILKRDYGFVKSNFKDALLEEIKLGFNDLLIYFSSVYKMDIDELLVKKPVGVRHLLQNFGTEVRREMDGEKYWINKWRANTDFGSTNIVVDDVRFLNEADEIRSLGGIIIRIERDTGNVLDLHQSEMEMDGIVPEYIIDNNYSLAVLENSIDTIIQDELQKIQQNT